MLISLALHLILLMFELLVCDKLETSRHLWILVFIPLIFISIVSIAVCIWAVKHERSFEVRLKNVWSLLSLIDIFFTVGVILCCECLTIYISSFKTRWLYRLVLGGCICAIMDSYVFITGEK